MKKFLILSLKTAAAFALSFSFALLFCATLNGFLSVSVFGGLFLATAFGLFND